MPGFDIAWRKPDQRVRDSVLGVLEEDLHLDALPKAVQCVLGPFQVPAMRLVNRLGHPHTSLYRTVILRVIAGMRFMAGLPMKAATKTLVGSACRRG